VAISARVESELGELEPEDAAALRAELGVAESGLERVTRAAFELLDQIASSPQARPSPPSHGICAAVSRPGTRPARSTPTSSAASSAPKSSTGASSSTAAATRRARERGVLRLEGRDYPMRDGDVLTVKFTP